MTETARGREGLVAPPVAEQLDPHTGLGSRAYLELVLPRILAECETRGLALCLLFVDVDHLKRINDVHGMGHGGNVVLDAAARAMRGAIRDSDVVVRYGGDEFLALLVDTIGAVGLHVGERVRRAVEKLEFPAMAPAVRATVSVGVAERRDREPFAECVERASEAMLRAKADGRNRVERNDEDEDDDDAKPALDY